MTKQQIRKPIGNINIGDLFKHGDKKFRRVSASRVTNLDTDEDEDFEFVGFIMLDMLMENSNGDFVENLI